VNGQLTLSLIAEAPARIRDKINLVPVMTCERLDALAGARLHFKCDNLQNTGAPSHIVSLASVTFATLT